MQSNEEFVKFLGKDAYGYVNLVRYSNPEDGSSYVFFSKLGDVPGSLHVSVTLFNKGLSNHGNKVHRLRLEYASEGS
ncbi:unnamed protein product, partial [Brassica oleracea]